MMISRLKHKAEIWEQVNVPDEYGTPVNKLKLFCKAMVAMEQLEPMVVGNTTKSINHRVKITMRHSRTSKPLNTSMTLVINDIEYDIITPPNNPWGLNKYTTFEAVVRGK